MKEVDFTIENLVPGAVYDSWRDRFVLIKCTKPPATWYLKEIYAGEGWEGTYDFSDSMQNKSAGPHSGNLKLLHPDPVTLEDML